MPVLETKNGSAISYVMEGSGVPLVFLHGWLMSGRVWAYQRRLAERFTVIVADWRGHGDSTGIDFSYAAASSDLQDLLDHLDIKGAVLVGWSMGAQIALYSWSSLCSRIAGMVLVGGTPRFCLGEGYEHGLPPAQARSMALRLRRNFVLTAGEFYRDMFSVDEMAQGDINAMAKTIVGKLPGLQVALSALDELVRTDLRGSLPSVSIPVLLIHGDSDTVCPAGASRYMHDLLPDSRLEIFTGCGHAPFLTRVNEFNLLLSGFAGNLHG